MTLRTTLPKPKTCELCQAEFTSHDGFVTWCDFECGFVLATAKLGKAKRKAEIAAKVAAVKERKADAVKRQDMKTIAQLIAAAQIPFNLFIRLRDQNKGCFVCARPFRDVPGQVQHAGHVRSRGAAGHLRFNESNCLGECEGCNGPNGAKPHQIKTGAIERIGQEQYDALEADNTPHKWGRDELIAIKADYTAKARQLQKGMA